MLGTDSLDGFSECPHYSFYLPVGLGPAWRDEALPEAQLFGEKSEFSTVEGRGGGPLSVLTRQGIPTWAKILSRCGMPVFAGCGVCIVSTTGYSENSHR